MPCIDDGYQARLKLPADRPKTTCPRSCDPEAQQTSYNWSPSPCTHMKRSYDLTHTLAVICPVSIKFQYDSMEKQTKKKETGVL